MYRTILFGIFAWYAVNFSLHNLSVLKVDIYVSVGLNKMLWIFKHYLFFQ